MIFWDEMWNQSGDTNNQNEEWDEDHALDMVLNEMIEDIDNTELEKTEEE